MCSVKDKINVQNFKICCCNASQTTKNTSRLQVFAIIIDVCVCVGGGGGGGKSTCAWWSSGWDTSLQH